MFARFAHVLLIVALIGATGTHWMLLQSVAWAKMLSDNTRTESFQAALEKTFDGKHPCALCKQIAKGKQSDQKTEFQNDLKKLEFLHAPAAFVFCSPQSFQLQPDFQSVATTWSQTPPVPPPRTLPT
ncbi:MAG: hypothetical protein JWQ71_2441 [Pedosphaera sp.]|nr:hypothetical protein [Pedosphaera sp.]